MCSTSSSGPRDGLWRVKSRCRWEALREGRQRRARSSGSSRVCAALGCSHSLSSAVASASKPSSAAHGKGGASQPLPIYPSSLTLTHPNPAEVRRREKVLVMPCSFTGILRLSSICLMATSLSQNSILATISSNRIKSEGNFCFYGKYHLAFISEPIIDIQPRIAKMTFRSMIGHIYDP